eukprot:2320960-Pleurochrysis_carterae.AAC.2
MRSPSLAPYANFLVSTLARTPSPSSRQLWASSSLWRCACVPFDFTASCLSGSPTLNTPLPGTHWLSSPLLALYYCLPPPFSPSLPLYHLLALVQSFHKTQGLSASTARTGAEDPARAPALAVTLALPHATTFALASALEDAFDPVLPLDLALDLNLPPPPPSLTVQACTMQ